MSKTFHDLKIGLDDELEEQLQWLAPNYSSYHVLKKSVDARRRGEPHFVYSVEVFGEGETPPDPTIQLDKSTKKTDPVLVIGAGPAGLFAALRLLERGIPCILIERGSPAGRAWTVGLAREKLLMVLLLDAFVDGLLDQLLPLRAEEAALAVLQQLQDLFVNGKRVVGYVLRVLVVLRRAFPNNFHPPLQPV